MEQTKVQRLARVLRVLVLILFVCNLLALFFVPGVAVMGGFHGLRRKLAQMTPNENPWELPMWMLMEFAKCWNPDVWASWENGFGPAIVVICLMVSGICTAAILWQGKRVLETVIKGNPFTGENAVSLRRAAVYCWIISAAAAARFLYLFYASGSTALFTYNTLFIPIFFVGGLLCMVMSALFRQAAEMKEDQDLTI